LPPLKFSIKPDATPYAAYTPATVPVHWQEQIKQQLARDVELGIIEPVPTNDGGCGQEAERLTKMNCRHAEAQ
jgi:hypothetical protein